MKKRLLSTLLVLCMVLALAPSAAIAAPKVSISEQYLYAGNTDEWYTEESYRATPVVIDLDGDGKLEVLNAAYTLTVMDAATGEMKWRVNAGKDRSSAYDIWGNVSPGQVFCDFKVVDIDADGKKEIVIGYGEGTVSVLDNQGYFKPGWPQKPSPNSIRSIAVDDLNGDGKMEIAVGVGVASSASVWVYNSNGTLASGWPQLDPSQDGANYSFSLSDREYLSKTAYSYGVYSNGISTGDLDGDGLPEIIVPTDTPFIDAYNYDGSLVKASDIYSDEYGSRMWGKIGLWEDYDEEIAHKNEGWGLSSELDTRAHTYKAELGHAKAIYTDVDGDGVSEVVVTALIVDRTTYERYGNNSQTIDDTRYMTAFILNRDRSRYVNNALGFDWSSAPNETNSSIRGPLLSYDSSVKSMAGNVFAEPVCADLDGDGYKEILFNSYDGKVHCFSLDKSEWSYTLPKTTSKVYEYASPVVCKDLDGDGTQEVIFASWTDCQAADKRTGSYGGTGVNGALYVLSSEGKLLASMDLHNGYCKWEDRDDPSAGGTNGVMASPTVADIDGDGKYEVLLNTTGYALCAYELTVESAGTPAPTPTPTPDAKMAYASTQTVELDGRKVEFQMYALKDKNGNDTNYIKARDLAMELNGTAAQFNVNWDGAVNLVAGEAYQSNGSEGQTPFSGNRKYYDPTSPTNVNGAASDLQAFQLRDDAGGGYTYYQLRDLGRKLGFNVGWSAERGVYIESDKPYSG